MEAPKVYLSVSNLASDKETAYVVRTLTERGFNVLMHDQGAQWNENQVLEGELVFVIPSPATLNNNSSYPIIGKGQYKEIEVAMCNTEAVFVDLVTLQFIYIDEAMVDLIGSSASETDFRKYATICTHAADRHDLNDIMENFYDDDDEIINMNGKFYFEHALPSLSPRSSRTSPNPVSRSASDRSSGSLFSQRRIM